jgi:hypothetical protein
LNLDLALLLERQSELDPTARTLEAFKLHDGQWLLQAGFVDEADVAVEPFEAVPFPLDALWAE